MAYAAAPYGRRIALGCSAFRRWCSASGRWPSRDCRATPAIPAAGWLAVALDAAHVAAAAVWAGGLLQLAWVTPHATRGLPDAQRS